MANEEGTEKKSFVLFYDQFRSILNLTDEQRGRLLKALYAYEILGDKPDFSPKDDGGLWFVFDSMSNTLDREKTKWFAKSSNGKKGGRPPGNQNARKKARISSDDINIPEDQLNGWNAFNKYAKARVDKDDETPFT